MAAATALDSTMAVGRRRRRRPLDLAAAVCSTTTSTLARPLCVCKFLCSAASSSWSRQARVYAIACVCVCVSTLCPCVCIGLHSTERAHIWVTGREFIGEPIDCKRPLYKLMIHRIHFFAFFCAPLQNQFRPREHDEQAQARAQHTLKCAYETDEKKAHTRGN